MEKVKFELNLSGKQIYVCLEVGGGKGTGIPRTQYKNKSIARGMSLICTDQDEEL